MNAPQKVKCNHACKMANANAMYSKKEGKIGNLTLKHGEKRRVDDFVNKNDDC